MLGAYLGFTAVAVTGWFWPALVIVPPVVGVLGALLEASTLRFIYRRLPIYQLLLTFGIALILEESVRVLYGPTAKGVEPPALLEGAVALGGLFVIRSDARSLFDGLTSGGGLVAVLASGVAGAVTLWLVASGRYGPARVSSAAAVAALTVGWVLAQDPYVLPPRLTLHQAAASDATLATLLVGLAIGAIFLVPSLWYLYRLVLQGRLDQEFEPLHQRFQPVPGADDREPPR
jgi:hypothetical protein